MPPRRSKKKPVAKPAKEPSRRDSPVSASQPLQPTSPASVNQNSWSAEFLRHARIAAFLESGNNDPAVALAEPSAAEDVRDVNAPLARVLGTELPAMLEGLPSATEPTPAGFNPIKGPIRPAPTASMLRGIVSVFQGILSDFAYPAAMNPGDSAPAAVETEAAPSHAGPTPSEDATPTTPTPSSPVASSSAQPSSNDSTAGKVLRHSAPAIVTLDTPETSLDPPEPSAAVMPSRQQRAAEPELGQNGSMEHWMELCFVEDADGRVEFLEIAICAREFLNSFGFHICYLDEQQLVYIVLDNFDDTSAGVAEVEGQGSRFVHGVRWSEAGLAFQARPLRPRTEPKANYGCAVGFDPIIISSHPSTSQLVMLSDLLGAKQAAGLDLQQLDMDAMLRLWLDQSFVADSDCAVEQTTAFVAYNTAFDCVRDVKPLLDSSNFEKTLVKIFSKVTPLQVGWKRSRKAVYHGLRWGSIIVRRPAEPGDLIDKPPHSTCCNAPEDASLLDPDGSVVAWLREVLVADSDCFLDPFDVTQAWTAKFSPLSQERVLVSTKSTIRLLRLAFGQHLTLCPPIGEKGAIVGLRWSALEGTRCSFAPSFIPFSEPLRRDAHKLLHLPQPKRTLAWLYMYFTWSSRGSVSADSLYDMYKSAFGRSSDTHPILPRAEFEARVKRAFKHCELKKVSDKYFAFHGLAMAFPSRTVEQQLLKMNRRTLKKHQRAGNIVGPAQPNTFTMHLLRDPLFMSQPRRVMNAGEASELGYNVPRHVSDADDKVITPTTGGFVDRLERRGRRDASGRDPLGDEEPGFPGVSMKLEQKRLKELHRAVLGADLGHRLDSQPAKRRSPQFWFETVDELLANDPRLDRPRPCKAGAPIQHT